MRYQKEKGVTFLRQGLQSCCQVHMLTMHMMLKALKIKVSLLLTSACLERQKMEGFIINFGRHVPALVIQCIKTSHLDSVAMISLVKLMLLISANKQAIILQNLKS